MGGARWEIKTLGCRPKTKTLNPKPCRVPDECPLAIADLITRCMDSKPGNRPSAKDVVFILSEQVPAAALAPWQMRAHVLRAVRTTAWPLQLGSPLACRFLTACRGLATHADAEAHGLMLQLVDQIHHVESIASPLAQAKAMDRARSRRSPAGSSEQATSKV